MTRTHAWSPSEGPEAAPQQLPGPCTVHYSGDGGTERSRGGLLTPSEGPHDPKLHAVFDTIVAACRRHGVVPGIHGFDPPYSKARIAQGFQWVTCGVDVDLVYAGAADHLRRVRG